MTETLDVGAGNYSATLAIAPDAQSLARSLREIRIPLQFRVDLTSGTPNARPFLSVDLGAAGAGAGAKAVIELKCSHAGSVCRTARLPGRLDSSRNVHVLYGRCGSKLGNAQSRGTARPRLPAVR
jgi:hypothetical protein